MSHLNKNSGTMVNFAWQFRLSNFLKCFVASLLFVGISISSFAQVPSNDEPCNGTTLSAIELTPAAACTFTTFSNVDASNSTNPPNIPNPALTCGNLVDADVWFTTVVPPGATSIVVDTRNIGLSDGAMAIYTATGTCPNLVMTQLACDDNSSTNLSMPRLTISQPVGTRIYIRFWGFGGEVGTFGICVTANIPPANDNCPGAQTLTPSTTPTCVAQTAGTTNNATQSTNTPNPPCGAANAWNDDVWYKFTATSTTHTITLSSITGGSTTMVMNLYSGTCASLTQVNCIQGNVLSAGGLTVGTEYFVRVYNNSTAAGTSSNFNICVTTPPPPPSNDECTGATSLTVNPDFNCAAVTAGTTVSATQSGNLPAPACGVTNAWNDDVWYSFVATSTNHRIQLSAVTPATGMVINVYSGTCAALVQVPGGCIAGNTLNVTGLTVGTTYFVRVYTNTATTTTTATFNICVGTPPPPPVNDDCPGALFASVNSNFLCGIVTAGSTISATSSTGGASTPSCSATGINDDVWFRFVATNTSHRVSILNAIDPQTGGTTAMTFVVYSGTCGSGTLTELLCNTTGLSNIGGLTIGNTYYVRVFTTSATATINANFNLCIGTPPPPPANDDCPGAIALTVNPNQLCAVTTLGSTAGATLSSTIPTPTCAPTTGGWDDDVWYRFVAVGNNHNVSLQNVTGTATAMTVAVYSGNCGSLIQIGCSAAAGNNVVLSSLTPGQTYYVRVHTSAVGQDANFNICVGTPGPGDVCSSGNPFCSTSGVVYPSVTNSPSLGGGAGTIYGCLATTPNPTWFAFQIQTPGNLNFQVSQTNTAGAGIDVDFAAWGPFTSQAAGCSTLASITPPPLQPISCSYSTAAIETINIPNALVGQWYIVLITNFNGGAGTISFTNLPSSTGSTNCNIVCNALAVNNGPVCPSTTVQLTGSSTNPGAVYSWTGPNGFASTVAAPPAFTAPATPGQYTYTLNVTLGSGANAVTCASNTVVDVVNPPVAPTVVSPINYCQFATAAPLTATTTSAAHVLTFYTVPTGGTGQSTITPSTATLGSTTYYVSQKLGTCEGPRAEIVINITPSTTPAPIVVTPVAYCQAAPASPLTATASAGATLLWWGTSATGGTSSATAPTPSTTASGTTTYYVSQTIGSCESPRTAIVVNVIATSPLPIATTSFTYCQGALTMQLSATGTNLLWYTVPTGGVGSATAPTPSSATPGITTYYVTQNTTTCESNRLAITVNILANPAAPTVNTPVLYCQNAVAVPLSVVTGTNVTWFTVPTGGVALPGAPTPVTTTTGSTTWYVQSNNGICPSVRTAIVVTVNATPTAPTVVTPVQLCQGVTAAALTAVGTNLLWYTAPSGGIGSATAPVPNTVSTGSTFYYVSSTLGTCEGPRSLIVVNVNPTPPAPVAVNTTINYCQTVPATSLTTSVNPSAGATLLWWGTAATGGSSSATAPTPSTTTAGATTYYVSQIIGSCESPRTAITVNVTGTPAVPTVVSPVTYCTNVTTVAISATPSAGNTIIYFTTPTGGTGTSTAPIPSSATAGTTTYYAAQQTATPITCEGPRVPIVVTVNPRPAAPTVVSPLTYCQLFNAPALTAGGSNLLWYTQASGGTGSATAIVPNQNNAGSINYYVSQSALGCEGPRATITVNTTAKLEVDAGVNRIIARGDTAHLLAVATGTAASSATYLWTTLNSAPLALTSATIANPIANPIQTTTYRVTVTDPSGICPTATDTMRLTVVQSCVNVRNAFTPNGDGINDLWLVYDQNFCLLNGNAAVVTVFNRYGTKVFESKTYDNRWNGTYNGKPLPDGTYFAIIEFTLFDGTKQTVRTDVTILR
jgi:gliding motility-associated-like protein